MISQHTILPAFLSTDLFSWNAYNQTPMHASKPNANLTASSKLSKLLSSLHCYAEHSYTEATIWTAVQIVTPVTPVT